MKKIVPFKKDIIFKTNLAEITSISLEHSLRFLEEHLITGEFMVSGEYLMTDSSSDTEMFSYNLPFDIHLDEHYITDGAIVDINDFYYEIIDNNVLSVNIEVIIDKLEEKELVTLEEVLEEELEEELEPVRKDTQTLDIDEEFEEEAQVELEPVEPVKERVVPIDINETTEKIDVKVEVKEEQANLDYSTYRIYILREEDTLETVLTKYAITKEELEEYNNLNEIKIGDKLIIPSGINR